MSIEFDIQEPELHHWVVFVRDMDLALHFFGEYTRMRAVRDFNHEKTRAVFLQPAGDSLTPGLLLIEQNQNSFFVPVFRLSDRHEVERVAEKAKRSKILVEGPCDGGPLRGFFCRVQESENRFVEFFSGRIGNE